MKTLRVCNKSFGKGCGVMMVPRELLEEGLELVKGENAKDLVLYGLKVKGMSLPESIASTRSWQKAIIGLIAYGDNAYDLKEIEWCAFGAPHEAFLIITMIVRKRRLPDYWLNTAIGYAHYSAQKFKKAVYNICKYVSDGTIDKWLGTKDNPWYQIAGICACAEKPLVNVSTVAKCELAYQNLTANYSERFDGPWLAQKFHKIL